MFTAIYRFLMLFTLIVVCGLTALAQKPTALIDSSRSPILYISLSDPIWNDFGLAYSHPIKKHSEVMIIAKYRYAYSTNDVPYRSCLCQKDDKLHSTKGWSIDAQFRVDFHQKDKLNLNKPYSHLLTKRKPYSPLLKGKPYFGFWANYSTATMVNPRYNNGRKWHDEFYYNDFKYTPPPEYENQTTDVIYIMGGGGLLIGNKYKFQNSNVFLDIHAGVGIVYFENKTDVLLFWDNGAITTEYYGWDNTTVDLLYVNLLIGIKLN